MTKSEENVKNRNYTFDVMDKNMYTLKCLEIMTVLLEVISLAALQIQDKKKEHCSHLKGHDILNLRHTLPIQDMIIWGASESNLGLDVGCLTV